MAAEKGRSFLLKWSDGTSPISYTTVAGARTTEFTINTEPVDITNKDDAGWRTVLEAAGGKSVTISQAGIFKDSVTEAAIRTAALAETLELFEIVHESGDILSGTWHIDSLQFTGNDNEGVGYSMTLSSSGEVTFTAA